MSRFGRHSVLVAMAAAALGASRLHAERRESPDVVCVISVTAEVRVGNRLVDTIAQGAVFEPAHQQDGWLWSNSRQGWVRERDVLPLNEAIIWFGREMQKHPQDARLVRSRAIARFYKSSQLQGDASSTVLFALNDVNRSLKLDPKNVRALCLRGEIRAQIHAPDLALEDYNLAASLAPTDEQPLVLRAAYHMLQKDYARAEADIAAAVRHHPDSITWYARALLHQARENSPAALEDLDRAIRANPYEAAAYTLRAIVRLRRGEIQHALADARIAVRLDDDDSHAWALCAEAYAQDGKHRLAVDYYTRAIGLNPLEAGFYASRAKSHFELRRDDSSIPDFSNKSGDAKKSGSDDNVGLDGSKARGETDAGPLNLVHQDADKWFGQPTFNHNPAQNGSSAKDAKSKESPGDQQKPLTVRSDPHAAAVRADLAEARRLDPNNSELLTRCGVLLWKLSDLDAAISVLDEAVALRPEVARPYAIRGNCRLVRKEFDGALGDFDLALERSPGDAYFRCCRARARISTFEFCGAEEDARVALASDPRDTIARTLLMVALELQGRTGDARQLAQEFGPGDRHERMALLWYLEGEHDRAEREWAAASAISTHHEWRLGACNASWAKAPDRLLESYQAIVAAPSSDADPSLPVIRFRGDLARRQGLWDQAIVEYTSALERFPCNPGLWVRRARACIGQRDLDRAAADLAQALSIDSQCSFALAARAELAVERGHLNAALDDCHAALRCDAESVEAYVQLSRLWRIQGHFEQCLSDAAVALSLNPFCAEARREQGFAWLALHDEDSACEAFRKCLEVLAVDADAHFGIAEAFRILQHDELAIQHYHEALVRRPTWAAALGGRGLAWLHDGNQARAAADFEAALELDPDEVHALAGRGELRRLRGEYAPAAADLRHALRVNPDFTEASESLAWILSACPDGELRDGQQAVALAKHAVRIRPTCNRLQALAAAFAEVGDFAAAEDAEKQALEAAPAFARKEFDDRLALFANHQPVRLEVHEAEGTEIVPVPEAAPAAPFEP